MKVIYFGTSEFAVPALHAISHAVSLVVSQPDRPGGRGMRLQASPVKTAALELGLKVETPEKSRAPEFVERLLEERADALVVAAYGQILSQKMLDSAHRGGINLHGSILPAYRGAAPIQRSLLNGDSTAGVTLMQMDRGMDTGDMISAQTIEIHPTETFGELQTRLAALGAQMIMEWLPRIVAGDYPRIPQDSSAATMAPKIDKGEAELRFDRPSASEFNRYRAVTPNPGAFLTSRFGLIRLVRCSWGPDAAEPGIVLSTSPTLRVAFSDGCLGLDEIRPEGKRQMRGTDFANGARLRVGDRLL